MLCEQGFDAQTIVVKYIVANDNEKYAGLHTQLACKHNKRVKFWFKIFSRSGKNSENLGGWVKFF